MKRISVIMMAAVLVLAATSAQATFWEQRSQLTSLVDDGQIWAVQGFDEDSFVAVGMLTQFSSLFDAKMVFRSLDGGVTVDPMYSININPFAPGGLCKSYVGMYDLAFTNAGNGLVFGSWAGGLDSCGSLFTMDYQPYIINTADGGVSWGSIAVSPVVKGDPLRAVDFLDTSVAVAAGATNSIWITGNGGATWAQLGNAPSSFTDPAPVVSVAMASDTDIYLATEEYPGDDDWWDGGDDDDDSDWGEPEPRASGDTNGNSGQLIYSNNGGTSWTLLKSDATMGYHKVQFVDEDHGWLLGVNADDGLIDLMYTTDGGTTWNSGVLPNVPGIGAAGDFYQIADFQMLNAQVGWAVGYGYTTSTTGPSVILTTSDGGANWIADDYAGTGGLLAIHMISPRRGFAVGERMTVVAYVNNTNEPPIADAGEDASYTVGQVVDLDGTGSYDPDGDELVSYTWTQVTGPDVALTGADTDSPSFTALEAGNYAFELVVSDGTADSTPDQVVVTVSGGTDDDDDDTGDDDADDDDDDDDGGIDDDDDDGADDDDDDDDSGCCG